MLAAATASCGAGTSSGLIVFSATPGGSETDQLFSIRPSGGGLHQLTKGEQPAIDPAFSPAGTRLAFARAGVGIFTMEPDGRALRRLTSNGRDSYPAWSPDGKSIAFVRPTGGEWRLYVLRSTGGRPRPLSQAPPAGRPSWTTRGLLVPSGGDLLRVDPANGHVLKYYGADIDAVWGLNSVALSPTLALLTYVGARSPDPGDKECGEGPCQRFGLYLESLTSRRMHPRMIVKDTGPAAFSPDGRRIVFAAAGRLVLRSLGSSARTTIQTGNAYPTDVAPPTWR